MATLPPILPHTTRAAGTILSAAIYNEDHEVHITNVEAMVEYINEFVVGIIFRGIWDVAVQYNPGDMVERGTTLYVTSTASLGEDPLLGTPWHNADASVDVVQTQVDDHEGRLTALEATELLQDAMDASLDVRIDALEASISVTKVITGAPYNCTPNNPAIDNTAGINAALADAASLGITPWVPAGVFYITGNLLGLHNSNRRMLDGDPGGSIQRGVDNWKPSPQKNESNRLYVNAGGAKTGWAAGSESNDGITALFPLQKIQTCVNTALLQRQGESRVRFTGTTTDQFVVFAGWRTNGGDLYFDGDTVALNAEPTSKLDGARFNTVGDALYDITKSGFNVKRSGSVHFANIECIGFPKTGWTGTLFSEIFYDNCWADGNFLGEMGFHHRLWTYHDYKGGKTRRCKKYGWLELWHTTRNLQRGNNGAATVTGITKAASAVVTVSVDSELPTVGDQATVYNIVSGMTQINESPAIVTAVDPVLWTITLALDSTAFGTFAGTANIIYGYQHIFELNTLAHKAKENCQGHGDGSLYQDNSKHLVFTRFCGMNANNCRFIRATSLNDIGVFDNKAPISLLNDSRLGCVTTGPNACEFGVDGPNANAADDIFECDSGSGIVLSEQGDPGLQNRIINKHETLEAIAQAAVPAARNNTTRSMLADLNTTPLAILRRRGNYMRIFAHGSKTGTAGVVPIDVAVDTVAGATISAPADCTLWDLEFDVSSTGINTQFIVGKVVHNSPTVRSPIMIEASATWPIGDRNFHAWTLNYSVTAGDTIKLGWARKKTIDRLNDIGTDLSDD